MKENNVGHSQAKRMKGEEYKIKICELLEMMDSEKLRYYYIFIIQRERGIK